MNLNFFDDLERAPVRIAGTYAFIGAAWILVSDSVAAFVQNLPFTSLATDVLKGLLFIAATAGLVFLLVRRAVQRELASRAEIAAAQERFRSAATQFPYALAIFDGESRLVFLNARGTQLTGKPLGELLGRRLDEVLPSPLANACRPMLDRVGRDLRAQSQVLEVPWEDGPLQLAATVTPLLSADGGLRELHLVLNDLTSVVQVERRLRRANRSLQSISAANSVLIQSGSEPQLLQAFCDALVGPTGHRLVWVGLVSPGEATVRVAAHAGPAAAYLDGIEVRCDDTALGRGPSGQAIRTGQPQVCHDLANDERMTPWQERAATCGIRSSVALPIRSTAGVIGVLTMYSGEAHRFDEEEVALLMELAEDLAFGLTSLRRREALAIAEATLSKERQLRESFMANSAALIFVADLEDRVIYLNPALEAVLGQPAERIVGRRRPELLPPFAAAQHRANDLEVARRGQPMSFEEVNEEGGGLRHYFTTKFPLRNETGQIYAVGGISTDVTDLRKLEAARQTSEARLAFALEQSSLGAWELDLRDHSAIRNLRHDQIFGYETLLPNWTYEMFLDHVLPEDRTAVDNSFQQAVTLRTNWSFECRIRRKDGAIRWIRAAGGHEHVNEGTPCRMAGIVQDISSYKEQEAALRTSETRLRLALAAAAQGLYDLDLISGKAVVNAEYALMLGYDPADFQETNAKWIERLHPEDRMLVAQTYQDYIAGRHEEYVVEFRQRTKSGNWKWILSRGSIVERDANGVPTRMLGTHTDITARKEGELVVRASEAKFRALFESNLDGLLLTTTDGGVLAANPAACQLLRRTEAEICAGGRGLVVDAADERLAILLEERRRTGRSRGELRMVRGDGTTFEAEMSSLVFQTPEGERTAMVIRDITQRQQAEAQVRDALAYLGAILEASPVGIISYDETGQGRSANEAAARMVGSTVEQLLALNFRQIASWRNSGLLAAAERALERRQPERIEAHFTTTFGKEVWLAVQFVPFQRGEDWHLLLLQTDFSDRARAMAQLRLQSTALQAAANAIVITNHQGIIAWVNDAFTRTTGYTREEAIGNTPRVLKSGKHPREFYEHMWKTIHGGGVWHGEIHNVRKDGSPLEEDATITPVRDAAGKISHFIAIKQDITERKSLERQLLRAQRLEGIGLLAGGIAHDLNNVLAPILMGADLLKLTARDEQVKQQLDSIVESAKRGADIVKQVLTFARGIEGERIPIEPKHVIKEMAHMARETFPRNLQIRVDVPNDLWTVMGDPTQLHQVLLNLSVNARDAMPQGGILSYSARNVEVDPLLAQAHTHAKPGPHVVLRVQDTGTGIPPEVLDRIFEPFFTTKELGKGTGLGLSTAMGIVRSHGGFITVESEPGKGTAFEAWLPASPQAHRPDAKPAAVSLPRGQGELVLVVDDEGEILHVTRAMLERHGYRVLTASDGTLAITELSRHLGEVRLVITDILMPFMDGVQLIHALRRMAPELRVIASSGALGMPGQKDRTDEVKALGVRQILHKPYSIEQLLRTVHDELHPNAAF